MSRQAGFSLIEVMIALTIMALAAGAVVMTVGAPGGSLAAQTDRLIATLVTARDAALAANRHISVEIAEAGYRTITHSQIAPPRITPTEAWAEGVSVASGDGRMPLVITFDSVGLTQGGRIELRRGGAVDGVVIVASGEIRRPNDAS